MLNYCQGCKLKLSLCHNIQAHAGSFGVQWHRSHLKWWSRMRFNGRLIFEWPPPVPHLNCMSIQIAAASAALCKAKLVGRRNITYFRPGRTAWFRLKIFQSRSRFCSPLQRKQRDQPFIMPRLIRLYERQFWFVLHYFLQSLFLRSCIPFQLLALLSFSHALICLSTRCTSILIAATTCATARSLTPQLIELLRFSASAFFHANVAYGNIWCVQSSHEWLLAGLERSLKLRCEFSSARSSGLESDEIDDHGATERSSCAPLMAFNIHDDIHGIWGVENTLALDDRRMLDIDHDLCFRLCIVQLRVCIRIPIDHLQSNMNIIVTVKTELDGKKVIRSKFSHPDNFVKDIDNPDNFR